VTADQWTAAHASIAAYAKSSGTTPVISVFNASDYTFWKAEEYHQKFYEKMGETCGNGNTHAAAARRAIE
jgi:peptide methionine sulfoxide reductase MsrA